MIQNLRDKALKAYDAIFSNQRMIDVDGRIIPMSYSSVQGLRKFNVDGYNYIEQNPEKSSGWARMAREGHRIMWVMKGRRYLAQVRDGVFHDFRREE